MSNLVTSEQFSHFLAGELFLGAFFQWDRRRRSWDDHKFLERSWEGYMLATSEEMTT